jgi:HAD superfamily hydrolase (TIGR01509 family)
MNGAIFDIDGTLLDSMKVWDDLGARYLRSLGIVPQPDLGKILFPMTLEEGCAYMKEHYSLSESVEEIREGVDAIFARFYNEEVQAKPGASELLKQMSDHGIPMVLATVGDAGLEKNALTRLGLFQYFRKMFNCGDYGTSKREPDIYLKAAEFLGTKIGETLVVEDTYAAVHSAHSAGFIVAAVEDEASSGDRERIREEADYYVTDLREIGRIFF